MKEIFSKIGYSISSTKTVESFAMELLIINNPDGSPRWIWKSNSKKPIFLKFYNVGSKRAVLFATLIKLVFKFGVQKLFFKRQKLYFSKKDNCLFDINEDWVLFTGTVGPNNKIIVYTKNTFLKIATTENSKILIQNEHSILSQLEKSTISFNIPHCELISENTIQLSDVSENGTRIDKFSSLEIQALKEMEMIEKKSISVKDWDLFQELKKDFLQIKDSRIPKNLFQKINEIVNQIDENELVTITLSHGDFTQWNMFKKLDSVAIYDWELASFDKPLGFDYFHFIIQKGVLVDRKTWSLIYNDLEEANYFERNELDQHLKWYLLINCMRYLKIYSEQKEWHIQIEWLLTIWNQAFNRFMASQKSNRQLLIVDFFDFLQSKEYGALKFKNEAPDQLSINSDIDLVIHKKDNSFIEEFLKSHALVSKIIFNKKSFMNTIQIFLKDSTMLSIDLIWQLKIKNLEILDAKKILKNNFENEFRVKNVSDNDTAKYVVLFYILNNSKIPEKYLKYQNALQNSNEVNDNIFLEYFENNTNNKDKLIKIINSNPENKGINYIKNTFLYYMDSLKKFKNKGFILTFSGVDGAGKSTIIENISTMIEKQLRKPVVVIRHRHSILPILSVYTKGKEKAHLDTISSLPRQGKNKSFFSSLLRFGYYYMDYFVGQFYIYFKYVSKGTVVIYDRYYFDFINDSKRSNIVLPKKLTSFGYTFLLKPNFNFFLYADAEVILKRKEELTKETIEALTKDYTELFVRLQDKNKSSIYLPINNLVLEETLDKIMKTITK